MHADNPKSAPECAVSPSMPNRSILRRIGTAILAIGLAILVYGAAGFWLINALPPNGGANGRLPSLYVMGMGIVVTLLGLATRGLRFRAKGVPLGDESATGIPTIYGILLFVAILIALIVVISR